MANVGKWELGEHLGSGVTGEVYLAKSEGQTAVLKRPEIAKPQPLLIEQQSNEIRREAETIAALALRIDRTSDALVNVAMPHVLDKGEIIEGGITYFYFVMEAAQGMAVEKLLQECAPGFVTESVFLRIVVGFARVLLKTRNLGYLYSDVKPDHLYWDSRQRLLTVIDWGNCRTIEEREQDEKPRSFKSDWQDYQKMVRDMLAGKDIGHFGGNVRQSLNTLTDANVPAEIGVQTLESLLGQLQREEDTQLEELNKMREKELTRENLNKIKSVADVLYRMDPEIDLPDTWELYWGELRRLYKSGDVQAWTLMYQLLADIQRQFPDREPERVQFLNDLLQVSQGLKKRDKEQVREGAKKVTGLVLEGNTEKIVKGFYAHGLHKAEGAINWHAGWLGERQPTLLQGVIQAQNTFVMIVAYFREMAKTAQTEYQIEYFQERLEEAEESLGAVSEAIDPWESHILLERLPDLYSDLVSAFDFSQKIDEKQDVRIRVDGKTDILSLSLQLAPLAKRVRYADTIANNISTEWKARHIRRAIEYIGDLWHIDPDRDWDAVEKSISRFPEENKEILDVPLSTVHNGEDNKTIPNVRLVIDHDDLEDLLRDFNEALKAGKYHIALDCVTELEKMRSIPQAGRRELVTCFELLGKVSTDFKTSPNYLAGGIGDPEFKAQKGLLQKAVSVIHERLGSLEQLAKFSSSRVFSNVTRDFNYEEFKDYAGTRWVWRALELWEKFNDLAHSIQDHQWARAATALKDIPELSELSDAFVQLSQTADGWLPETPPYWDEVHIDKVTERLQAILEAFSRVEQTLDSNALSRWLVGVTELRTFRDRLSGALGKLRNVKTEWLTLNTPLENQDSEKLWDRAQKVLTVVSQFTTFLFTKYFGDETLRHWQSQFNDATRYQPVEERLKKVISNHPLSGFLMWAPPFRSDWDMFWDWLSEVFGWLFHLTINALLAWLLILILLCIGGTALLINLPQALPPLPTISSDLTRVSTRPGFTRVFFPSPTFRSIITPTSAPLVPTLRPIPTQTQTINQVDAEILTENILDSNKYFTKASSNEPGGLYYDKDFYYHYRVVFQSQSEDLSDLVRKSRNQIVDWQVKHILVCFNPFLVTNGARYGIVYGYSKTTWDGKLLTDWRPGVTLVQVGVDNNTPQVLSFRPTSMCLKIEKLGETLQFYVNNTSVGARPSQPLMRVGLTVEGIGAFYGEVHVILQSLTIAFQK